MTVRRASALMGLPTPLSAVQDIVELESSSKTGSIRRVDSPLVKVFVENLGSEIGSPFFFHVTEGIGFPSALQKKEILESAGTKEESGFTRRAGPSGIKFLFLIIYYFVIVK